MPPEIVFDIKVLHHPAYHRHIHSNTNRAIIIYNHCFVYGQRVSAIELAHSFANAAKQNCHSRKIFKISVLLFKKEKKQQEKIRKKEENM